MLAVGMERETIRPRYGKRCFPQDTAIRITLLSLPLNMKGNDPSRRPARIDPD